MRNYILNLFIYNVISPETPPPPRHQPSAPHVTAKLKQSILRVGCGTTSPVNSKHKKTYISTLFSYDVTSPEVPLQSPVLTSSNPGSIRL
jgi:hypothetical protein